MADTLPSDEDLRARFHDLGARREAIMAAAAPLRQSRDDLVNANRIDEAAATAAYKSVEDTFDADMTLYDIDMERARLARFLGGKTGPVPA